LYCVIIFDYYFVYNSNNYAIPIHLIKKGKSTSYWHNLPKNHVNADVDNNIIQAIDNYNTLLIHS
jgi:hypothetical protein